MQHRIDTARAGAAPGAFRQPRRLHRPELAGEVGAAQERGPQTQRVWGGDGGEPAHRLGLVGRQRPADETTPVMPDHDRVARTQGSDDGGDVTGH